MAARAGRQRAAELRKQRRERGNSAGAAVGASGGTLAACCAWAGRLRVRKAAIYFLK